MAPIKKNKAPKTQVPDPDFSLNDVENVINEVIAKVRQDFVDDGAGEEALQALKHNWCSKLMTRQSPPNLSAGIPPSNDEMKWSKNKDLAAGRSTSSAASVSVKQERKKEPATQPKPEPSEEVILKEE